MATIGIETIFSEVKNLLQDKYHDCEINMDTFLEFGSGSFLDMSSLDIVEFIVDLETKYDIIIDIEDRYYTVGDAVRGVEKYLREKEDLENNF